MVTKLPEWFRIRYISNEQSRLVGNLMSFYNLNSVCQSAHCPNRYECWSQKTASFMIMGEYCTRGCRFCAVKTMAEPPPLNPEEPENLAEAISKLGLKYVVVTSVDRDDLEDGGSWHFARCIRKLREKCPDVIVEALIPDFRANESLLYNIIKAKPHVVSHNLETVERLTPEVRDRRAGYLQSLKVLEYIGKNSVTTKSGIMLGMGEKQEEIIKAMKDLRAIGVSIITIGQYLSPGRPYYPVKEYIRPEKFMEYQEIGYALGFRHVMSGPLVRSSYRAGEIGTDLLK
ncbi:lipoyl synthase [Candidatus Micrarchaeota archaeon]|nr:lipoyl synthase [Candidatus Micrarchaeota archaeon]